MSHPNYNKIVNILYYDNNTYKKKKKLKVIIKKLKIKLKPLGWLYHPQVVQDCEAFFSVARSPRLIQEWLGHLQMLFADDSATYGLRPPFLCSFFFFFF
jgi:hypothetical protein